MTKVILEGCIIVPTAELASVSKALETHIELTRQESGCLAFEITQDTTNPNKFFIFEEFANKAAFAFHQKRASESEWGVISKNVKRDYQIKGLE